MCIQIYFTSIYYINVITMTNLSLKKVYVFNIIISTKNLIYFIIEIIMSVII